MRNASRRLAPLAAAISLTLVSATVGGSVALAQDESSTLTIGMNLTPYGWDPGSQPGYQNWPAEAVWGWLAKCDSLQQLEPDVADQVEVIGNQTVQAHIRDGLTFSDGTPVDSAAVAASYEFAKTSARAADFEGIEIETPDAQNITITWPEPSVVINDRVCSVPIAPASYLEAGAFDVPISSGPYVYDPANSTAGAVLTFTKRPDFWNADQYPFDAVVTTFIENEAAMVSALKTGQVDAALVAANNVAEVKASGLEVVPFQGQTTRLLLTDHLGEIVPCLGDVRVRQAINMVFDKQAMADALYLGNAEPTAQVFRKGSVAYIDGLEDPYPYDVEAAQALMAEAGCEDGFPLQLPTMEGQNFETLMPYVTQQLGLLNIDVEQVPLSGANAIGDLLSGTYPVVLWQLGNSSNSAFQIFVESYPDGWWNLEHQPDEYVDSRYEQLATADAETSKQLQQEINRYIIDQAWQAPMVYMGTNFAYDPDVVSFPTQSDQEALTPKLRDFQQP